MTLKESVLDVIRSVSPLEISTPDLTLLMADDYPKNTKSQVWTVIRELEKEGKVLKRQTRKTVPDCGCGRTGRPATYWRVI